MTTTESAVVIAGAGPTGMMLAAELTLAGVDVVVVERRATPDVVNVRSGGLHARTIEELDQRGIADRFLSAGTPMQVATYSMIPLDIGDFPTRHPYGLALWQNKFEEILAGWVDELGVTIHRGCEVTGFRQDRDGVGVELTDGNLMRTQYLVGCDGGRSAVRKGAGIEFAGWDASASSLVAIVEMRETPERGIRRDDKGINGIGKLDDEGDLIRVVVRERGFSRDEPTLHDLSEALIGVWGTDYGVHSPVSISRFTDAARQAVSYRDRRVLLAGDAAHVHSPIGGQGLNIGLQDATNLGWKLAQVVNGISSDDLLDTYHAERHPIAARVLRNTLAQTALSRADDRIDALRDAVAELLGMDEPRKTYAAMMSGLGVRYDFGPGHPLLGRRMPDLDIAAATGSTRVFELLHEARPVLLDLGLGVDVSGVRVCAATYAGEWELPVVGVVAAPRAVLIRPDGYVAWVSDGTDAGLRDALTTWCGITAVA